VASATAAAEAATADAAFSVATLWGTAADDASEDEPPDPPEHPHATSTVPRTAHFKRSLTLEVSLTAAKKGSRAGRARRSSQWEA
jgi:hypothetical protein